MGKSGRKFRDKQNRQDQARNRKRAFFEQTEDRRDSYRDSRRNDRRDRRDVA